MPAFLQWGRGKRSVVLDLKASEGVEAARKLAATADVALENFRPGVADRMGIGYGDLSRENAGLVYCSITGLRAQRPLPRYQRLRLDRGRQVGPHELGATLGARRAGL